MFLPLLAVVALGLAWAASQSPSATAAPAKVRTFLLEAGRLYTVTAGGKAATKEDATALLGAAAFGARLNGGRVISTKQAGTVWRTVITFRPLVNTPVQVPGELDPFGSITDVRETEATS